MLNRMAKDAQLNSSEVMLFTVLQRYSIVVLNTSTHIFLICILFILRIFLSFATLFLSSIFCIVMLTLRLNLPFSPLNLIDGYENRFAYSLAFGVTTNYCLAVITGSSKSILGKRIAAVINAAPSYVESK